MIYCETCKYFQHTGENHDGKPYELGGKCDVKTPTRLQGNYCNGGSDACTMYEKACDGRKIPDWMVK